MNFDEKKNQTTGGIRGALDNAGFDWGSGSVFIQSGNTKRGLVPVDPKDPCLDGNGNYYAIDNAFVYMAAFLDFMGQEGVFPAKVRKDSIEEIEINTEAYFEQDPLRDLLKEVVEGIRIFSAQDVQSTIEGLTLHIVGTKDLPFFVVSNNEEQAIRLFMQRMLHSARMSVLNQQMERAMFGSLFGKDGPAN